MNKTANLYSCSKELIFIDGDLRTTFLISAILFSILTIPTVVLNGLVVVGIYKKPNLHTPSNILLCGLAITDLGAGSIAMPLFIAVSIAYCQDAFASMCNPRLLARLLATPFSGVTLVNLSLISLDRMIALQFHIQYSRIVTNQRIVRFLVFTWVSAILISFSTLWDDHIKSWSTVGVFSVCLVISSFNTAIIFRILQRHRREISTLVRQVQVNQADNINIAQGTKTSNHMLWVFLLFFMCYAPFLGARIVRNLYGMSTMNLYMAFNITYVIMYINSFLNPILYCIKMRPIRKAVFALMPAKLRFSQKIQPTPK